VVNEVVYEVSGEDSYWGAGGAWYWVGGQRGVGRGRDGTLGGGGVGVL